MSILSNIKTAGKKSVSMKFKCIAVAASFVSLAVTFKPLVSVLVGNPEVSDGVVLGSVLIYAVLNCGLGFVVASALTKGDK